MINTRDILETIHMIEDENLDIRTITMGISLLDCCSQDIDDSCRRVYDKIARKAEKLVRVGCEIEKEYGVPIINKRIAVTPIAMLAAASGGDPVKYALTLEKAAQAVGVNFIGGYSALVQKGFAPATRHLSKHTRSSRAHRARLLERQYRLDKDRHKHGRCGAHGQNHQKNSRAHRRQQLHRRGEARRILQRPRG